MWVTLLTAFGLMLILEGLLPFLAPKAWKDTFRRITELADGQIRFLGLSSIVAGIVLLFILK
ncbi:MAG: DUF2065 domain-containing protein [Rhodocyclaceae bacterium]|jgi:uncharacterized protein YjeT (DUF2065 family)|nr:DUF2065 domain-containing protein [Rhodocyclaceae bacterium]